MDLQLQDYKTAYISFSAEINPTTTEQLIAAATSLVGQGHNHLYVLFSTPGGAVMNGINVYNVFRGLPAKITFHNVGNVDSIGNAIFLAGDDRYACPHSTFMFHGVSFNHTSAFNVDRRYARQMMDGILADQKRIASIMVERTNVNATQAANLFKEAGTKDASYAASVGIVANIRDVNIPAGSPIFSLVFQR
jgi:ATP-dependent protease ClpP protease subunit